MEGIMLTYRQKFKIMQRRAWVCDRCGKKVNTRTAEIHHKNRNSNDDKPSNLRVLCKRCHLAVHGKV